MVRFGVAAAVTVAGGVAVVATAGVLAAEVEGEATAGAGMGGGLGAGADSTSGESEPAWEAITSCLMGHWRETERCVRPQGCMNGVSPHATGHTRQAPPKGSLI